MHDRKLDLNLLPVLDALLQELHISNAAKRLNMSQPAVSRALGRLRRDFDDQLLVRDHSGYRLTPRGEELAGQVHTILADIGAARSIQSFEPATFDGEFRICTLDYGEAVLLPRLQARLTRLAPNARIRVVHRRDYSISEIVDGAADLLIGLLPSKPPRHCVNQTLFSDRFVCVVCQNHPLANEPITLEDYLHYSHSIIHTGQTAGTSIDQALKQMGQQRRIARQSPHFVASLMSLAGTTLIQTIPESLANTIAGPLKLVIKELPLPEQTMEIGQVWHTRFDKDPAHRWIRDQVKQTTDEHGFNRS